MACSDGIARERMEDEAQRSYNYRQYGRNITNAELAQEMACEMAKILTRADGVYLPDNVRLWIAEHRAKDEREGRKW
jgi:hypothetical protein